MFLVMDERKNIQSVPEGTFKRFVDLSLMGKEGKRHFVFIKDFSTFLYDHTLLPGRKHFYCYFLQAFSTTEIFKNHVNCFEMNAKQMIKILKKGEFVRFKNCERKIKLFMIYAGLQSIFVPENNGKKNPDEYYTSIYQKNIA